MFHELFSKRYGLRPTPEGLVYEGVPKSARVGLNYILEQNSNRLDTRNLYTNICAALRIPRETRNFNLDMYSSMAIPIEELIMKCDWWRFYDICELMFQLLDSRAPFYGEEFSKQVNALLIDEQLGFEIRDGKVEKVGSGFVDSRIKEARYLLKEPEFKGADKHFEKALKAINTRPNPDVENCVKDAVAAIESVGRIIVKDDKAMLSNIIKDLAKKEVIPKPLDEAIQKINAYRGDQPGVAHGLVGVSKVTIDEAEFVLAMSAAIIIYLVKKSKNV